jgi:hypothetical protein
VYDALISSLSIAVCNKEPAAKDAVSVAFFQFNIISIYDMIDLFESSATFKENLC